MPVDTLDTLVSFCKRRGFIFPGSEIYGGMANSWDYGPLGVELKNNIKQLWWRRFVHGRDDVVGVDSAIIMNPKVWEATGHVATFSDPLAECKKCHFRLRVDVVDGQPVVQGTPECQKGGEHELTEVKQFNLLFQTIVGPAQDQANIAYFRPETAQGMFVNFKHVLDTGRKVPPFGIAQMGKAFRNEITPGNFIFRTREFEQMEIEYFIPVPVEDADWQKHFESWRVEMVQWLTDLGVDMSRVHELEVPDEDRAFYSKRTIDFEYDYPFGRKELYGLAYRTDFDLQNHEKSSGKNLKYRDPETGMEYLPHVIEPTWGVDRTLLVVLLEAYDNSNPEHAVLRLKPALAPYKAAVFPLLRNKPELVAKAREVYDGLRRSFAVTWDDRGNIGKRYFSQDEIGTPYCITIDFQTLEDGTVTVRDRDTGLQERVPLVELDSRIAASLKF